MNLLQIYEQPALPVLAAFLLAIGIYGLIRRRTLVGMLIAGELIFSAAPERHGREPLLRPRPAAGQIFVLVIMGLAAAEVAIGLSIIIAVYRNYRSIRTRELSELNG
jgi:NADH:ubiquinone oxidoreductase subunit K